MILRATVRNDGDDGDVIIDFNAFENSATVMATIPANATREVSATLSVPAGILQGTYPAFAKLDSQQANADVAVTAPSIALELLLDKAGYPANTNGVARALVRGLSGASQQYDVAFRYRTGETLQTITLGAGDTRDLSWSFDAGQTSDRLTVIVSNHTSDATAPRYNIAIDSLYVNVIDDDRAWIESDKRSYNAGEVVHLTLHATKPLQDAIVLAPNDMPGAGKYILWNDLEVLSATGVLTNVIGTFNIDYPLPAVVPTGRYAFTLQYNGESRAFPIDVHGITAQVEDFSIGKDTATPAGIPLTLSANVRSNVAVPNARLSAYAVAPDGSILQLGSGADRTLALAQGVTPAQLTGVLNANLPGAYRVILRVFEAGSYTQLAGASGFLNAGNAAILSLSTDHGVYAPNQLAQGSIGVYGIDSAANIKVATSGGTVLLDSTRALTGYAQLNFSVPTAALGDEVLIGMVTGSDGMTSSLQAPYRVAASFDVTAPVITILSPAGTPTQTALITLNGPASHNLNVNGTVNDASAINSVLVNGVTATLAGNAFSAAVPISAGFNFIDVIAKDIAGNIGFTSTTVLASPARGLTFTVTPTTIYTNQSVVYRAVLTASEDTTATVVFGENEGVIQFANASASGGAFTGTVANTRLITWSGAINANAQTQIVLTGTVIGNPPANGALTSTTNLTATFVGLDALTAQTKVSVSQAPANTATPTPTSTSTSTPTSTSTNTPTPTSTNTPTPSGNVDLSIQVSDGKQALLPGGVLIYAIAYANTSAITATNVRITETVPANARFVLAQSVLGWSCANNSPAGSACVLNVGTLAPGARGSAVFAVLHNGATSPVVITNTVKIGSANVDANLADNTASTGTPLILAGGIDVTPLLECVIDRGASANPRYAAVFGYNNPNAFAKSTLVGNSNKFAPTPQGRGQPIAFLPGRQRNAFFVDFNSGTLTWTLGSKTASAATSSPKCASTTKIVSGSAFLDADGNGLRGPALQEPGLPLIVVHLTDASGAVIDARVTALDGRYSFVVDNPAGKSVQVILPALLGLRFTTRDANAATKPGNDASDSAIDLATWRTLDLGALPNPLQGTVNAGLRR